MTIVGRDQTRLNKTINTINNGANNTQAKGIVSDRRTKAGTEKIIAELTEVDILINNFGIYDGAEFLIFILMMMHGKKCSM